MDLSSAGQTGDGIVGGVEGIEVIVRTLPGCVVGGVEGTEVIVMTLPDCVVGRVEGTEAIVMTLPDCVVVMTGLPAAPPLAENKSQLA